MMSPSGIYWNLSIFVNEEPMQHFVTLAGFFLVEKKGPQKKKERRARKNDLFSGHTAMSSAHTPLGPKNRDDYKQ